MCCSIADCWKSFYQPPGPHSWGKFKLGDTPNSPGRSTSPAPLLFSSPLRGED